MSLGYPTISEAVKIWNEAFEYRKKAFPNRELPCKYIYHTKGVAEAAQIIAGKIPHLNSDKAYVLGLLHDYGKRIKEKEADKFHGQEGYEAMLAKEYPDVAKICLTHSFPNINFNDKDYSYPIEWMNWVREKLKTIEYDDYDRLIQLCDKFYEETSKVSIRERAEGIAFRYGLAQYEKDRNIAEGLKLKTYFDKLCGQDIYDILDIRE